MDGKKEEVRDRCIDALLSLGASNEFSQFYAEVLQCEYDITHSTYSLQKEIRETSASQNGAPFYATIQKLSKHFNCWRTVVQELSAKKFPREAMTSDAPKFAQAQRLTAVCSLETNELRLNEGEEMVVTDASQPNQLKVRNPRGEEGYVPSLSCVLPVPDSDAFHAIERLEIQLLTSWTDCVARLRPILHQMLTSTSTNILTQWMSSGSSGRHPWQERVSRRMKRINDIFAKDIMSSHDGIDLSRLHKTLSSLENELTWQKDNSLSKLIDTISNLDKTILCYQAFRKQWLLYRKSLKESVRPIRIVSWDPKKFEEHGKNLKYFELKLTAEEVLTKEETVYLRSKDRKQEAESQKKKKNKKAEMDQLLGGSKREKVLAEEITSRSHEENKKFVVKSVVDPRNGVQLSIKEAVSEGILNHQAGLYINPSTGQTKTISAAMAEGLIQIEYATTTRTNEKVESIGVITIRTQVDNHEYAITGAVDTRSGDRVDADEARRREAIDEAAGYFVDLATGDRYPLDEAIERGWVFAQYDDDGPTAAAGADAGESPPPPPPQFETKTYAVSAVVDQVLKRPVPFVEAIRKGLIDRETGNYINNATGERFYAAEAIRRGFFKSVVVDDPTTLNIDATNRVVVDRIEKVRKNVLRGVRVMSAFSKALKTASATAAAERRAATEKKE